MIQTSKLDLDYYENIILYNALVDQEYLSAIAEYTEPQFFVDKDIKAVFTVITEFFRDRGSVPTTTEIKARLTTEELRKSFNVVGARLKQFDKTKNKDELYSNTERFLKERCLYRKVLDIAEKISDGTVDVGEALLDVEKAYNINLAESLGHWYFDDIDKHIKELTTTYNPMPTGWKFLDEKLDGGWYPKTLNIFAGQVNVGKSIVLGNITVNTLLADKNVVLITLEMSEHMYARRISSQLTQIPGTQLKVCTDELKEQIAEIKANLSSRLVIKEYPPKTITVRHIDAYLAKISHKGFKPDILVVDYINLIKPVSKNINMYEGVKEVAEQLRALSFKYNIPVVTATQVNRSGVNVSHPGLENTSESLGTPATADTMFSLWQEEEDKELGRLSMGMMKNRFGPNYGHTTFQVNYDTLTLKEANPDFFEDDDNKNKELSDAENMLDRLENSTK